MTRPIIKISLLAPFESALRARAYEALYAVKLALREHNEGGDLSGWLIELVALDWGAPNHVQVRQIEAIAADPDIFQVIVLAPTSEQIALLDTFTSRHLPVVFADIEEPPGGGVSASFAQRYRSVTTTIEPGPLAERVYTLTNFTLSQLEQRIRASSTFSGNFASRGMVSTRASPGPAQRVGHPTP
ncbi:MAG: hypothetical protein HY259_02045 [Chloroflexi bacterium]|nr:hypothetical protein [Chloroflexota bacterium]